MKKFLLIISIFALSACTVATNTLPLFIYDMSDPYMEVFSKRIENESGPFYNIDRYDASNSQIIQNEQIESAMEEYNVLIVNPVDRLSVFSVIQKAEVNNTKLIFFNREPLNNDLNQYAYAYYVGADAKQSAQLQAELITDLFGEPEELNENDLNQDNIIQAVILKGEQGHQDAEARTEFVVKTLEEAGYSISILDTSISNWDQVEAKSSILNIFNTLDGVEVVISNNDAMALGAIEALKELGYFVDDNNDGVINRENEKWFPVVGIDGLDEAIDSIMNGYLFGTIVNDSQTMAEVIVELARLLVNNQDISQLSVPIVDGKYIWIDYQKLTFNHE